MSQVYLNKVQKSQQTVVINLGDLGKAQLLKELSRAALEPDRFVLAAAEELPEVEGGIAPKDMLTLGEWLEENKVALTRSEKHRLANIVSRRYQEVHQSKPRVISRPDAKGRFWVKASGFQTNSVDIQILKDSLLELRGIL